MEATAAAAPSRARILQAFQSRDFRLLWTGQAISLLGDAAFVVALNWRAFTLTGDPRSVGIVLTLQGVGVLTTVLVGGALADRYDRLLMELVPRNMLSRVVSLDWFGSLGLTPFGLLLMGALSDFAAPGTLIALAAAISICVIACGLLSKQIRTID